MNKKQLKSIGKFILLKYLNDLVSKENVVEKTKQKEGNKEFIFSHCLNDNLIGLEINDKVYEYLEEIASSDLVQNLGLEEGGVIDVFREIALDKTLLSYKLGGESFISFFTNNPDKLEEIDDAEGMKERLEEVHSFSELPKDQKEEFVKNINRYFNDEGFEERTTVQELVALEKENGFIQLAYGESYIEDILSIDGNKDIRSILNLRELTIDRYLGEFLIDRDDVDSHSISYYSWDGQCQINNYDDGNSYLRRALINDYLSAEEIDMVLEIRETIIDDKEQGDKLYKEYNDVKKDLMDSLDSKNRKDKKLIER